MNEAASNNGAVSRGVGLNNMLPCVFVVFVCSEGGEIGTTSPTFAAGRLYVDECCTVDLLVRAGPGVVLMVSEEGDGSRTFLVPVKR